jgi:DNA-binding CsgD family transcriptional regulator
MMSTLRAVKRADVGPIILGPAVGMALRQAEGPSERVTARPMALRIASGQLENGQHPAARTPDRPVAAAPPAPAADSADQGETGWEVQLTGSERRYVETKLRALTVRERDVLFAICQGGTNEAIADRLCVALPTVRTHLMRLNQKLGTTSKGDVVRFVLSHLLTGYREGVVELSR